MSTTTISYCLVLSSILLVFEGCAHSKSLIGLRHGDSISNETGMPLPLKHWRVIDHYHLHPDGRRTRLHTAPMPKDSTALASGHGMLEVNSTICA